MKILTIGTDRKLFEDESAVAARQIKYGQLFDRLDIIVFARRASGLKTKKLSANVTCYPTNSLSKFLYFIDAFLIARKLNKPDLVSAQDPFESGVAAYLCSRYFGAPLHLQIHTDFLSPYFVEGSTLNKIRVLLARFLIKRAAAVRVVTERVKRSVIAAGLIGGDKITVLPIFVNVNKIKNAQIKIDLHKKYPQFDFIILMASRVTKEKNIELAIEAMAKISKKHPNVGLVIVGEGLEQSKLVLLTTHYQLLTNVIFESWSNDLPSYYKTADIFLLTSNYEGYGMTVVEALSAGLPVIMSDVGIAGEILIHKKNGLVFGVGNREELIKTIERYIGDSAIQESIREGVDNFSMAVGEEEYLEKYRNSFTTAIH